jgi:hypothetical protein
VSRFARPGQSRRPFNRRGALALFTAIAVGCGTTDQTGVAGAPDGSSPDGGSDGSLVSGDVGANCDGGDQQGCACGPTGTTRACNRGGTAGVGACVAGVQTCVSAGEFGEWGACVGAVGPTPETCGNGVDDDCNGLVDDGCSDAGLDASETCSANPCAGKCSGADDGCGGTCATTDCAGCCTATHRCIPSGAQTSTDCGAVGASCSTCASGQDCNIAKHACETKCTPACAGKCDGDADGCGGTCATSGCAGCCTATHRCVPFATQTPTECGQAGATCAPCQSFETCASTTPSLGRNGCYLPPTFQGDGGLVCPSHVWTDAVCNGTGTHFDMSLCQYDRNSPNCSASSNPSTGALDIQCSVDVRKTGAFSYAGTSCVEDFLALDHRLHNPAGVKRCLVAWGVLPLTSAPSADPSSTPVVTASIPSVSSSVPLTISGLSTLLPAVTYQHSILEAPPIPLGPVPVVAPNVYARRVLWEEPSAAAVRFTMPAPYDGAGLPPVSYPTYEALLLHVYDNEVFPKAPTTPSLSYPDSVFLLPFWAPYYTAKLGTSRLLLISEVVCETDSGTLLRSFDVVTSEPH